MNVLLVFFALPLATIIIAIVLERVWGCYKLVTAAIFAVYLIVVFALFDASFLVFALIYTILAFIASYLSMTIRRLNERLSNLEGRNCNCQSNCSNESEDRSGSSCCRSDENSTNLLTISSRCGDGDNNELLTINTSCSRNNNDSDSNDNCNNNSDDCCNSQSQNVAITARVSPNFNNNGRTGSFRGCYRRRW